MNRLFVVLLTTSLIFAETSEDPKLEEVAITEAPTFSSPSLPDLQIKVDAPLVPKSHKNAWVATTLSALLPGLGHTYLGDYKTAGTLFGSTATFLGAGAAAGNFSQNTDILNSTSVIVAQNTWMYGIFAAYRDVRIYNGNEGYKYQMPQDSYADLASAPFKWAVLKKPEVWGGLLAALSIAAVLETYAMPNDAHVKFGVSRSTFPLSAFTVGIGEEAFFRGFLQSAYAENASPAAAIITSSIVFGAAHVNNAQQLDETDRWRYLAFGIPFITSFGGYFGWLTHKNRSLKESVALHSWYDFILFTGMAIAGPSAATGHPEFAIAFNF